MDSDNKTNKPIAVFQWRCMECGFGCLKTTLPIESLRCPCGGAMEYIENNDGFFVRDLGQDPEVEKFKEAIERDIIKEESSGK